MKNLFLISLLVSSFFVHSQEVPDPIRAEYLMCNLNDEKSESKIGVSCRKCDRLDCSQRAFPPDTHNYDVNINQRGVSIFVNG